MQTKSLQLLNTNGKTVNARFSRRRHYFYKILKKSRYRYLIQRVDENGKIISRTKYYVSRKWFHKGTLESIVKIPVKIKKVVESISNFNRGDCRPEEVPAILLKKNYVKERKFKVRSLPEPTLPAFRDPARDTMNWIVDNLKGGTYKFHKAPGPLLFPEDHIDICKSINKIYTTNKLSSDLVPNASHCANAGFIGFLLMLKKSKPSLFQKHKESFMCSTKPGRRGFRYGKGYVLFANNFKAWVKKYLGKDHLAVFSGKNIDKYSKKGIPKLGDSVNIYRKSRSGHQVIFSHYQSNPSRICYWSSNGNHRGRKKGFDDGMGQRCERTSKVRTLTVGIL